MDDFEKKELEELQDEATATEAAQDEVTEAVEADGAQDADALVKELEEIRDMFQEAIDNAAQDDESGESELIQELEEFDGEEVEAEEEIDLPLCECCGEKTVSTLHGEDYPYCEDCRDLMKHYPLRISGVLALIVMVVVFAATAYLSSGSLDKALTVLEARTYAGDNKMMSAVNTLYSFASDKDNDSAKAIEMLVDGFVRTGYVSNAKEVIEANFTAQELEKAGNKKYKQLVEFVDSFITTREAVEGLVSDAFSGKDFDCDELIAKLEAEKEKFIDEEKGIKYNAAILDYYKYEALRLAKADPAKQLEALKAIEDSDKDGLAEWIYVGAMCETAAKMGDKDLAEKYFDRMKKINAEDMKAYSNLALYYRYLETPDADAMIALCEEAAENAPQGDTSYYPTLVVAYLIKGEGALALDTMAQYMNSNYYTVTNCNLYALCAAYCGNDDVYKNMDETLKNAGFELSDLVVKYKNGKISLDEVIADMRGDVG